MELGSVAAVRRSVDELDRAALALHTDVVDEAGVLARLERIVVELGLATAAAAEPVRGTVAAAAPGWRIAFVGDPADPVAVLRWTPVAPDDPDADETLAVLAAHAAAAVITVRRLAEVARREQAVRQVAGLVTEELFPPLPALPGTSLEVEARTSWADLGLGVGGDFYDVFELPDATALVVVGDVVGKGVRAAGHVSRITQTLRALALQGLPLDEVLVRTDAQVRFQDPEIMATLWCGLYEPESGELRFASLGHPPALLLRGRDDSGVRLELTGLPLGMGDLATGPPEVRRRLLEPRDLLVLYTDGVVEAHRDFLAGQEALLEAVRRRIDEPLAHLISGALDELLEGAAHTDDAVMLLLRRR